MSPHMLGPTRRASRARSSSAATAGSLIERRGQGVVVPVQIQQLRAQGGEPAGLADLGALLERAAELAAGLDVLDVHVEQAVDVQREGDLELVEAGRPGLDVLEQHGADLLVLVLEPAL